MCTWLSADSLQNVRREVRRLLVELCGNHQSYRTCRYFYQFHSSLNKLYPLLGDLSDQGTLHDTTLGAALAHLKVLYAAIEERPKAWAMLAR